VRVAPGSPFGLLYVDDATWDEYAVLAAGVDPVVVRAAYRSLPNQDVGADVEDLVRALQSPTLERQTEPARFEAEL